MFLVSSSGDRQPCRSQDRRGLVAKDRSRVALCVRFKVDRDADATAGRKGGGRGEAGGVAMVLQREKLELVNII